jgi:hypothetical protein
LARSDFLDFCPQSREPQGMTTRSIPVYTASGERMPLTFGNFEAAEEFQRTVIADLAPNLLSKHIGICRLDHPDKIGRPLFRSDKEKGKKTPLRKS